MMKYRSRKAVCNQMHKHASKKEAHRCDELTVLEGLGKIKELKQQPVFPLQERFEYKGKIIRPIKYMADFSYIDEEQNYIVEDTKGFRTSVYLMKVKLLKYKMRDVKNFSFIES